MPRINKNSEDGVLCPKCNNPMRLNGVAASGAQRWRCDNNGVYCYSTTNPGLTTQTRRGDKSSRPIRFFRPIDAETTSRYIVTSAQNATPVHELFFQSLLTASKHLNAELIVIPIRYKNPTSRWTESQANAEWWVEEVQPYLYNTRKKLNPNLVLLGDVKTQPTASSPLTGFEGMSHGESCIIGHTKVQLKVVPVPAGKLPKIMTTTGACTFANYTDTKAGKLGDFHHTLGAVVVEVKGKRFHLRQISANKDGSFIDLDKVYSPKGVTNAPPALGLILGDVHTDFVDPNVVKATFGKNGMCEILKPQHVIFHDLMDGTSVNPHEVDDIFASIAKRRGNKSNVRAEVERACAFIDDHVPSNITPVIVDSNHSDFLRRWVIRSDWRDDADPSNAEFYLETALSVTRGAHMKPNGVSYPSPFAEWAKKLITHPKIKILNTDESFALAGIELGLHGDKGPNGSRGTIKNIEKVGAKTIIGHSHTPSIEGGSFQTGTSSYLKLGYNSGPSSWLQTHCVVYANGKRSLLTVVDGEWRNTDTK